MSDVLWVVLCLGLLAAIVVLARRLRGAEREIERLRADAAPRTPVSPPAIGVPYEGAREILESMGEGVLLLDRDLAPVWANTAARNMLGLRTEALPERIPSEEVLSAARRALDDVGIEEVIHVWFPLPMDLRVRATLLGDAAGVVVALADVTEEVLAQRVRREFVAHASHELKSPVAGLEALAEAVQDAVHEDPAAAERFARRMVSEADRLGRLVADLLDLSRLEDPTNIPREPADLSAVARDELAGVRDVAEAKGITLSFDVDEDIRLRGDPQQLGLMVRNLLENAFRYTPSGGTVTLDVYREANSACLRVVDTGIGIPREAHGRIFERFYRVDRARARDRGGTGLGLAIVKHVAEMHGGRVDVKSELGVGSTFIVRLPAMDHDLTGSPAETVVG